MQISYQPNNQLRQSVGMMIINNHHKIFAGKRIMTKIDGWQMPQGGIDKGETPKIAVLREMHEEIGCSRGYIIAESKNWYSYYIPKYLLPKIWNGKYQGQIQKWFLIKFTGNNNDININTANPEFSQWKWVTTDELLRKITKLKYNVYYQVINEFKTIYTNII